MIPVAVKSLEKETQTQDSKGVLYSSVFSQTMAPIAADGTTSRSIQTLSLPVCDTFVQTTESFPNTCLVKSDKFAQTPSVPIPTDAKNPKTIKLENSLFLQGLAIIAIALLAFITLKLWEVTALFTGAKEQAERVAII
jgi:hypothetical protein